VYFTSRSSQRPARGCSSVHRTGTLSLSLSLAVLSSHCLTAPICPSTPLSTRQHHCPPVNTTVHPSTPLSTRQRNCHTGAQHTPAAPSLVQRDRLSARAQLHSSPEFSLSLSMVRPLVRHIVTLPSPEPVGAPRVRPPAGRTRECCRVVAGLALTRASGQPGQTPIKSTSVSLSAYLSLWSR